MPLLEGLDGINKMSKSLNNYVGITESPKDIFGKLMSVSDELMWRYIELLSFESSTTIQQWKRAVEEGRNPREIKVKFAQEVVARFHSAHDAEMALADFEARFKRGALPDDIPETIIQAQENTLPITQLLKLTGLTASTSEAIRLIKQGGIKLDNKKIEDKTLQISQGKTVIIQVGKRKFAKVTITK
jgi:tyrosyl-tRNA synthetase